MYLYIVTNEIKHLFAAVELKSRTERRSTPSTCTEIRQENTSLHSGDYDINPDNRTSNTVAVYCDMTSKNDTGVTVIGHDSELRTEV